MLAATVAFAYPSRSIGASWIQPSDLALVGLYLALAVAVARRRVAPWPTPVAVAGAAYLLALALSIALADRPTGLSWLRLAAYPGIGFHAFFASVEEFRHLWLLLGLVVARRLRGAAASRA